MPESPPKNSQSSYHEVRPIFRLLGLMSFSVPSSLLTSVYACVREHVCVCERERERERERESVCVWLTTSHLLKLIALWLYASLNTTTLYCYNALTITAIKAGRITPWHCSSELQHTDSSVANGIIHERVVKTLSLLCKSLVMFWW